MANKEHLKILEQGVEVWNQWRIEHPKITPYLPKVNLSNKKLVGINLSHAVLFSANFEKADLQKSSLSHAILFGANFKGTNLANTDLTEARIVGANFHHACLVCAKLNKISTNDMVLSINENNQEEVEQFEGVIMKKANMYWAEISEASLTKIDMEGANLERAILFRTNFSKVNLADANLSHADLTETTFINSNINNAIINHAQVYGISTWDLEGVPKEQRGLKITPKKQAEITVDHLEVAQFIYLMLNNQKIRDVIGTIAQKGVLILGRFSPERKKILDAIRAELRQHDFVPMMFDFEKIDSRDYTETVKILAGMSRFVIVDVTHQSSCPLELQATVPDYKIPFIPLILKGERPFAMLIDLMKKYEWVSGVLEYESEEELINKFQKEIIGEALSIEQTIKDNERQSYFRDNR